MSVDLRTRADGELSAVDPHAFFSTMYTSFRLPSKNPRAAAKARARLRAVREGAYTTVSQEPGHVTSQER